MHFVNSVPPFGLRRRRCGHVTALCLHAEFILLITITTLSYISRMDIYIHGFKLCWLRDNHL